MKNTIISLIILLLFSSQIDSQNISRSHHFISLDTGKTLIQRNTNNRLSEVNTIHSKPLLDSVIFYDYLDENRSESMKTGKEIYHYDYNNYLIFDEFYDWDENTNIWTKSYKVVYNYDSNNNLTLEKIFYWDETIQSYGLNPRYKFIYNYDSNNNLISDELHKFRQDIWYAYYKVVYKYSSNDNLVLGEYKYYSSDNTTNDWDLNPLLKRSYSYNINNNIISIEEYSKDKTTNDWHLYPRYKKIYSYDAKNNMISDESYSWNNSTQAWGWNIKYTYSYDSDNNKTLEETYEGDSTPNSWRVIEVSHYYYNSDKLATSKEKLTQVSIYPNPINSDNTLSISTKEDKGFKYTIFSSNGRLVISGTNESKNKDIDVSMLDKGIYILKITSDNKVINRKFIK